MAQPTFYSDGTTPNRMNTKSQAAKKWLGVLQNRASAIAANNPARMDSYRNTLKKINKALTGTA